MKKYNIGLDIGTSSVGWAVVESGTQKVIKKGKGSKRRALWGVRLFEEAQSASERRKFRSTRRRYDRRRERIRLLQNEFSDEINKVDSAFFIKLKESKYDVNDINNKTIILSKNEKEAIIEYNKTYRTIYHLRDKLINEKNKKDIRLVYLALHHIIKYRGNFLYSNKSFNVNDLNVENKVIDFFSMINQYFFNNIEEYPNIDCYAISCILMKESKNDVKEELKNSLINQYDKGFYVELSKALIGNKFSMDRMLGLDNVENKTELTFNASDYDDNYDQYLNNLGENIEILDCLKEIYDILFLKKLFKNSKSVSLSSLMVERYDNHQADLKFLKTILSYDKKIYNDILRSNDKYICVYDNYINNKITQEEFCKQIEKNIDIIFEKFVVDTVVLNRYNEIKFKLANFEFMPRVTDSTNGKFPYQLNRDELIKIIENQGTYYPFLLDKANDGIYKIVKLLDFKIPYYIGPLVSEKYSKNAWMERKIDNIKITPYNFDEVIDKERSAEKFIKRMISRCTYLLNEYALSNNSLLYNEFKVINELKQIRINGEVRTERLTNKQINDIVDDLFKKENGTITNKKFIEYLNSSGEWNFMEPYTITGYSANNAFANNMQSYVDFFGDGGLFSDTSYSEEEAEKIIEWVTIFEDKDILENKVRREFPQLNDKQIDKIKKLKYSGWGRLSKKLLTQKYYIDKSSGIKKSIIDLMNETDENFMQILNNDEYKFQDMIKECNVSKQSNKLSYDLVSELATSPATKKGIYQSLKVVDELVKYMGYDPERIVIEFARSNDKKGRTVDRRKYLENLYKEHKNDIEDYNRLMRELGDHEINSQKLFLYFIQEGKCLYSGKSLNIENLNEYEIDHIIPRTLIKDDSIDNKALVYYDCNQKKAASYVLPTEYNNKHNKLWWNHLKKIGLISNKKFHNLIRTEYKDEDIQGFINRQLVETRQITKHVANILSNLYPNSNVVYLKADLSHNYRAKYNLFKFRSLNDYHHAHDAYLAAVLGEFKEKYLNRNVDFEFVRELNCKLKNLNKYDDLKYGYVINSLDSDVCDVMSSLSLNYIDKNTGELLFDCTYFNKKVEDTLYRNDILISRKTEIRGGQFYKQTIYPKGIGKIPVKKNMPVNKYGGYSNMENAYLSLVRLNDKNKLIGIPKNIFVLNDNSKKIDFIRNHLNLDQNDVLEILIDRIPFESEFIIDNHKINIKGYSVQNMSCEISNAYQLNINKSNYVKWKFALEYIINDNKKYMEEYNNYCRDILNYLFDESVHYPLFKTSVDKIKDGLDFDNLSNDDICKIIKQVIILYQCNSSNANLKEFGFGDRIGRLSGKNISSGIVINKSVTGLYEERYEF